MISARFDTLRGIRLCYQSLHVYAAYLPRCPWCVTLTDEARRQGVADWYDRHDPDGA